MQPTFASPRTRLGLAATILFVVGALLPSGALAAPGTTHWVNDDKPLIGVPGQNCNKPGYATIQDAIDAAAPGDTVRVCAGTYFGAVVNKAVELRGEKNAVINDGPFSHPGLLRAGFLLNPDRSGSGATIRGFTILGAVSAAFADDGMLDFGIFSRGADDVTVRQNEVHETLQAITSHNGTGWTIEQNEVHDLWTLCGGGIGIIIGGFDGITIVSGNVVSHNDISGTLHVSPGDCGGYEGTGVVLYADFRSGRPGVPSLSGNTVSHNSVALVSDTPAVVDVNAIEVTEGRDALDPALGVVSGNVIDHNRVGGSAKNGILVSEGAVDNEFTDNTIKGATAYSCRDESTGTGTSGTANLWDRNKGNIPSLPAGICRD